MPLGNFAWHRQIEGETLARSAYERVFNPKWAF